MSNKRIDPYWGESKSPVGNGGSSSPFNEWLASQTSREAVEALELALDRIVERSLGPRWRRQGLAKDLTGNLKD